MNSKKDIWLATRKQGVFACFEVTIGWFGKERVDYMTYDTKGIWRCYEIKVSKSDFNSNAAVSFVGHYNYYVLTNELYEQVKNDIPKDIGIYVGRKMRKRSSKRELAIDEKVLCDSMIRSLYRYADDKFKNDTPSIVEQYKQENERLKCEIILLDRNYREDMFELKMRRVADRRGIKFNLEEFENNMLI